MTKKWEKNKDAIKALYLGHGKTLDETKKMMEAQHVFKASTRAYRSQFKKWGWTKYSKKKDGADMSKTATQAGPVQPQGACPMTPASSSQGRAGAATTRRVSDSSSFEYQLASGVSYSYSRPEMYQSSVSTSPSVLTTSAFTHHQVAQQAPVAQHFYNSPAHGPPHPQDSSDDGSYTWQGYQQQAQQQARPLRQIQAAPHPHYQHPQSLHIHTGNAGFPAPPSPASPATLPIQSLHSANLSMGGAVHGAQGPSFPNESSFSSSGLEMSKFEQFTQSCNARDYLSPSEILSFCKGCFDAIQKGADTSRILPQGLEHTIRSAMEQQSGSAATVNNAVMAHMQQHDARGDGLLVSPWMVIWVSACQQSLRGNVPVVEEHLHALSGLIGRHVDVDQHLRPLLRVRISPGPYATPQSSTGQQQGGNQNGWSQSMD